ncbi:MAG: Stf0 sulfotransferase family protein [Actinomycetota bacterium]|nr:Stf0 sulfotransferase family protein [Actinomycetota bacterium]MDQ6948108.1 Stf0 sulfotransferase family protein [Actinomycetota bacterium]
MEAAAGSERGPSLVPTSSYLICASPRTGSYLLCDGLTATGVAGRPTEFLMPTYRDHWTAQWGTTTYREFHQRVLAEGTTPNGVFGAKIHAGQFVDFLRRATGKPRPSMEERATFVAEWFPHPRYVWLRRRDQVGQAVSWAKACQTRLWWDADAPPAPMGAPKPDALRFDYQFIETSMYSLAAWDGVWRTYFDATGIVPVTVWYEDLVSDNHGSVERVIDHLGLGQDVECGGNAPGFRRQADGISAAWAAGFSRLHSAKREGTLAALAGMYAGETVYVCASNLPLDRVPRDAITIAVDGAASPQPASFALLTRSPTINPVAGVVVTIGPVSVHHSFVVRLLIDRQSPEAAVSRNRLAVGNDGGATDIAIALATHLGAGRIEVT